MTVLNVESTALASLLLQLRLASVAEREVLESRAVYGDASLVELLEFAHQQGWVRHVGGLVSGWTLTPQGRVRGHQLLRSELVREDGLAVLFETFAPLNHRFLELVSSWTSELQRGMDSVAHAQYLNRLEQSHVAVVRLLANLGSHSPRFGVYQVEFNEALEHIRVGDDEWLARPNLRSYHTVWFELHEHLLAVSGRERG